ncbi:LacI family DNA-binding transcriptional regulator [Texcoconibacillus texcoconensis]|nr:LacI family DNA-binding transcriptional regulator [Texcoconibacillus texcoconensis]
MTTIKDVANYANVSVATVSRVLNNKGYISKTAEEAVLKAIKELDYRPNSVARSLYHKTSNMIGLLMPDITNPFFPELARAVEDVAMSYGYTVVFCNTDEEMEKEKTYFEALKQKYVDGMILTTSNMDSTKYDEFDIPLVALDRIISERIPTVVSENKKGAMEATQHLIERDCKYIAHLRGPVGVRPADDRYNGFIEIAEKEGIGYVTADTQFSIELAEEKTLELFQSHPEIDGIFASSDVTAAGAMHALFKLNKQVPQDVKIVGFDGIPLGTMLVPSLTTIQQSIYKMGEKATQLLIDQIEQKAIDTYYHEFPTSLVVRHTT